MADAQPMSTRMIALPRKFRDLRYSIFYKLFKYKNYPLQTLGSRVNEYAWTFHPGILNKASIVYSGGIGRDITFEHALVEHYGCTIVLLDPSPTGKETMSRPENQIPQFRFVPTALAGKCGELTLAPPADEAEGSWAAHSSDTAGIKVPCSDLHSLMRQNQHSRIDLLKLDIEGSEYEVINDFLNARLPVNQLCVEFHHGMLSLPCIRRGQTIRAILKLATHGYRLIHVYGSNHTFLKR